MRRLHVKHINATLGGRIVSLIEVIFGAGSFSFGLYCWRPGEVAAGGEAPLARREEEAAAAGGALGRRVVEAVGEALGRRVVEAVGEALARRVTVGEEPGVLRGRPSEPAAGQELYVQPGAEGPAYAGPAAAAAF
jgi:hypothetical protein